MNSGGVTAVGGPRGRPAAAAERLLVHSLRPRSSSRRARRPQGRGSARGAGPGRARGSMRQAIPADAAPADDPGGAPLLTVPAAPRAGGPGPLATLVPMDNLGARLKELRKKAGLSLRELARQAEVSPSLVSQIENDKSRPSVSTLYTFARLLNVSVDELFDADAPAADHPAAGVAGGVHDPANAWHPSEYATR